MIMNYIKITEFDTANGDGVGTVLWVAGCSHNCPECHNPDTHDPNVGTLFTPDTMKVLLGTLNHPYIKRLTLSGGDPMFHNNRGVIQQICKQVKQVYPSKQIWLYTGYTFDYISDSPILPYVDILVDGPFIVSQKNLNLLFRGSENQRLIDVQKSLLNHEVVLWNGSV